LPYDDTNDYSDDYAEIQAIEEEQEHQAMPHQEPALFAINPEESHDQAAHEAANMQPVKEIAPILEEKSPELSLHQAAQASANFAQTMQQEVKHPDLVPVEAAPVIAIKPTEQSAPVEHIKIVKVYPVYDAVMSAFEHIKSATQDMINYVYSLVNKK